MIDYEQVALEELDGVSVDYLQDVISHGIHNLTNNFHGDTDADYEAFTTAFNSVARKLLELELKSIGLCI